MASFESLQVLTYPFLDMSGPHLCDCFKVARESRNPITFRNVKPGGEFTPALAQSMEDSFSSCSIEAILTGKIELHLCIWGTNWLIGVKVLGFQLVINHGQSQKCKPSVDHQYHSYQVRSPLEACPEVGGHGVPQGFLEGRKT
jgi:hypothetical protein